MLLSLLVEVDPPSEADEQSACQILGDPEVDGCQYDHYFSFCQRIDEEAKEEENCDYDCLDEDVEQGQAGMRGFFNIG